MKLHCPKELQCLIETGTLTQELERLQEMTWEIVSARISAIKKSFPPLEGNPPSYLELVRREETSRMMAEEEILPQTILLPAEP
ncbi:MAG: hypothetical protein AB7F21_06960 [Desulfuromonadales bacterium]